MRGYTDDVVELSRRCVFPEPAKRPTFSECVHEACVHKVVSPARGGASQPWLRSVLAALGLAKDAGRPDGKPLGPEVICGTQGHLVLAG